MLLRAGHSHGCAPAEYERHIAELVLVLNSLGVAAAVRDWLGSCPDKPRLGKALSLALELPPGRSSEFVL